jgi:tetratricopeptide (TPR) repeat protein
MRKINLPFLAGTVTACGLACGGTYALHEYEVQRNSSVLKQQAGTAEEAGDLTKAAELLNRYLGIRPTDGPTWAKFARLLDRQSRQIRRSQLYSVYETAVRFNRDDHPLKRRAAELALESGRHEDAERLLASLCQAIEGDPKKAAEAAEAKDLWGQSLAFRKNAKEAEAQYRAAINLDPGRVVVYGRLARLLHDEAREAEAQAALDEMLQRNPNSARALVERYRYRREVESKANRADIAKALSLDPNEPEALIEAAHLAIYEDKDLKAARKHIAHALEREPTRAWLYLTGARVELAEGQVEPALALLRRGNDAVPDNVREKVDIKVTLAETLINRGGTKHVDEAKTLIEGLDQIGRLDGYVKYLQGKIDYTKQRWAEAAVKLETARNLLAGDLRFQAPINRMLAECHRRTGEKEGWAAALKRLAAQADPAGLATMSPELTQALVDQGDLDAAILNLRTVLVQRPEARIDLVRLLIRKNALLPVSQRKWDEVGRELDLAAAKLPGAVEAITLLRADFDAAQGKLAEARAGLEQAIQREPKAVSYRADLARILRIAKDPAALKVLEQAEKDLGPKFPLMIGQVDCWAARGGPEARDALARLADRRGQLQPTEQAVFLEQLAAALSRVGDSARAEELLKAVAELAPRRPEPLMELGLLAIIAGDQARVREAIERLKRVEDSRGVEEQATGTPGETKKAVGPQVSEQQAPGTFWRALEAASILGEATRGNKSRSLTHQETARARGLLEEVITRRPSWFTGFQLRGMLHELQEKPDEQKALRDYLRAIDLGSNDPSPARRAFILLIQQQRFDQADELVRKLEDRGAAPAVLKLASVGALLRRQEFDRALAQARALIPVETAPAIDLLMLCDILLQAGRYAEAQKSLEKAEKLAPTLPAVWINWTRLLLASSRKSEVPQVLERAARALPKEQASLTLAQCQSLAGDDAEAEKLLGSALEQAPDDLTTLRLAADFYLKVNKPDKAGQVIEKLSDPSISKEPAEQAWARRARSQLVLRTQGSKGIDQALALIQENLDLAPGSTDDLRTQALILASVPGRQDDAIKILEPLNASGQLVREDRFKLARLYAAKPEWDKCRAVLEGLLREPNPNPLHVALYAGMLIDRGQFDDAELCIRRLKPAPGDFQSDQLATALSARVLRARDRSYEVGDLLRAFASRYPDRPFEAADQFERNGLIADAERAYRTWVAQQPANPGRLLTLASFLGRHDRTDEALDLCDQARKSSPPQALVATAVLILGSAKGGTEARRGRVEAWIQEALRTQSASSPTGSNLRLRLATLRDQAGRYDEEEALYREVLAADPKNLEALNNLAWLLALRSGGQDEALALIKQAIALVGPGAILLDTQAVVLLQRGSEDDVKAAMEALNKAMGLNPAKPVLYFHLARAHQQRGEIDKAREVLRAGEQRGLNVESIDPREREVFRKLKQDLGAS